MNMLIAFYQHSNLLEFNTVSFEMVELSIYHYTNDVNHSHKDSQIIIER